MTHMGIRVRFGLRGAPAPLMDEDSDGLYLMGKLSGSQQCLPSCLPGCDLHGWLSLTAELAPGAPAVVFEIKPVDLPDEVPDDGDPCERIDEPFDTPVPAGHAVDVGELVDAGLDIGQVWARAAAADDAFNAELQQLAAGDDPEA